MPTRTSVLKATLLGAEGVNGPRYLEEELAVGYTFQRYPSPPLNAPPSAPAIADLHWTVSLPTGGDPPIPGDPVSIVCRVSDEDGDPVTISLTLADEAGNPPKVASQTFPPGASSSEEGAEVTMMWGATDPPRATVTCRAVDASGAKAGRTMTIP